MTSSSPVGQALEPPPVVGRWVAVAATVARGVEVARTGVAVARTGVEVARTGVSVARTGVEVAWTAVVAVA